MSPRVTRTYPDPPRATLRVGVCGHRPGKLPHDLSTLAARIVSILDTIQRAATTAVERHGSGFARTAPLLRVVSSLAEGADRMVAGEALRLRWELQCPLPFERTLYEEDFDSAASREEYRSLLLRASAVLELDGDRTTLESRASAYEAAGRAMLRHADVLIAIWDGEAPAGRGGTGQMIAEARSAGIPVIWVQSRSPHPLELMHDVAPRGDTVVDPLAGLAAAIHWLLTAGDRPDPLLARPLYGVAPPRPWARAGIFRAFRTLLLLGRRPPAPRLDPAAGGGATEGLGSLDVTGRLGAADPASATGPLDEAAQARPSISAPLLPTAIEAERQWSDRLAGHYGDLYRSSYVANYLLGAAAVLFALLGFRLHAAVALELAIILAIILITVLSGRWGWHLRWLSFRLHAEQLRQLALLWPLGRINPSFRMRRRAGPGDPSGLWVMWLFRARVREAGLANRLLDRSALASAHASMLHLVEDQLTYHDATAQTTRLLHHRLHTLATLLFVLTALACILHLTPLGHDPGWNAGLTLIAAFLPACGAALHGVGSHGEFERLARESEHMAEQLADLRAELREIPGTESDIGRVGESAAAVMTAELLSWQATFRDKRVALPG